MSHSETEATVLLKQMSVPKLLIIAVLMGVLLGTVNALIPESISWGQEVIDLSFWSWLLKTMIGVAVIGTIVHRFKTGKLQWLRKAERKSK